MSVETLRERHVSAPEQSGSFFRELLGVWLTGAFLRSKAAHFIPLAFGILFWTSVVMGIFRGTIPLPTWMVCAYISVWITRDVVRRIFLSFRGERRYGPAMLLLALTVTLAANTFVLVQMLVLVVSLRVGDAYVLCAAGTGLAVVYVWLSLKQEPFSSDWALCGYSIALKSTPQALQAWFVYKGAAMLSPWSALFLFCQGLSRLVLSFGMWRGASTKASRAQLLNAFFDQFTIALIFWAVMQTISWGVFVEPLIPWQDELIDAWRAVR